MNATEPSVTALRRSLLAYRIALGAIAAVVVAMAWMNRPRRSEIEVFDVAAQVDSLWREHRFTADAVPSAYLSAPDVMIHLHAMAPHQICPLHVHERTTEATAIVRGAATVTHVFGAGASELSTRAGARPPGSIIVSPPSCGHEWRNASADAPLGNLVFTTPRFAGNHYVDRDDPLMLRGEEPTVIDVEAEIASAGHGRVERTLPFAERRLRLIVTSAPEHIDAGMGALAVYTVRGSGSFEAGRTASLTPARLVVLHSGRDATIRPAGGPIAVLVFRSRGDSPEDFRAGSI